jgi:ribonuclease D
VTSEIVTAARASLAADRIRASSRVGVDTEFHAENRYLPDLYLIQLGLDDGSCLLIDPLVPGVLDPIGPALRERPWVVHAGEHDLRILSSALGGPPAGPVFDTQIAAGLVAPGWPAGYATLCETWLGATVDKGETLSDWSRRPLTPAQLAYAIRDVQHLFPLADALSAALRAKGRDAGARAAMDEALRAALEPSPDRWVAELTFGSSLEPRQAAVLRALLGWRDERGRAQNVPPRVIAGDGVLIDLARRLPRTEAEVGASRRFPRNVARCAPELLPVIADALATPPESWPTVTRRGSPEARRAAFVQLWAQVVGEQDGWSAGLVVPREVADAIARGVPLAGWREALFGAGGAACAEGATLRLGTADVEIARSRT